MMGQRINSVLLSAIIFTLAFVIGSPTLGQINAKQTCYYHAWHTEVGSGNALYFSLEKSLAIRKSRKVNLLNKSEFTYLGLGFIGHSNTPQNKFYFGPTMQLQAGFAKLKLFWPTLRYSALINSKQPHRVAIGASYLPFKNCGIHYDFTIPNNAQSKFNLRHSFGISINLKVKKIGCKEPKAHKE